MPNLRSWSHVCLILCYRKYGKSTNTIVAGRVDQNPGWLDAVPWHSHGGTEECLLGEKLTISHHQRSGIGTSVLNIAIYLICVLSLLDSGQHEEGQSYKPHDCSHF
jgi:hypothetical protein